MNTVQSSVANKNRRTLVLLSVLAVGMFGFGFAMVPLYNLICQVTGVQSIQSRTPIEADRELTKIAADVADDRLVTIKFDATVKWELPWDLKPELPKLKVNPGKTYEIKFLAKNRSSRTTVGQAIPSVAPWQATGYLQKLECFCFNRQLLEGGEAQEMPLLFTISPDLPREINSLTLSYTFMKTEDDETQRLNTTVAGERLGNKL